MGVPPLLPADRRPDDEAGRPTTSTAGRDATVADLRRALGAGLESIEHVKRYTTIGTGSDQGRSGGVVASAIAAAILGQEVGAVGVPDLRPPYTSRSRSRSSAGRDRGDLPIRSARRRSSVARRARRRVRGRRPVEAAALLPAGGETMDEAVLARVRAARTGVAVMDATTLGKIDIAGTGRRELPRPPLHEHVLDAQGRVVPLRPDVSRSTAWCSTTA